MLVAVCAKLAEPTKWEASGRGNPSLSEQGELNFLLPDCPELHHR